jgi:hypothetical protein
VVVLGNNVEQHKKFSLACFFRVSPVI